MRLCVAFAFIALFAAPASAQLGFLPPADQLVAAKLLGATAACEATNPEFRGRTAELVRKLSDSGVLPVQDSVEATTLRLGKQTQSDRPSAETCAHVSDLIASLPAQLACQVEQRRITMQARSELSTRVDSLLSSDVGCIGTSVQRREPEGEKLCTSGLEVVDLEAGAPADRAGLRIGETITQVNGVFAADVEVLLAQLINPDRSRPIELVVLSQAGITRQVSLFPGAKLLEADHCEVK